MKLFLPNGYIFVADVQKYISDDFKSLKYLNSTIGEGRIYLD